MNACPRKAALLNCFIPFCNGVYAKEEAVVLLGRKYFPFRVNLFFKRDLVSGKSNGSTLKKLTEHLPQWIMQIVYAQSNAGSGVFLVALTYAIYKVRSNYWGKTCHKIFMMIIHWSYLGLNGSISDSLYDTHVTSLELKINEPPCKKKKKGLRTSCESIFQCACPTT